MICWKNKFELFTSWRAICNWQHSWRSFNYWIKTFEQVCDEFAWNWIVWFTTLFTFSIIAKKLKPEAKQSICGKILCRQFVKLIVFCSTSFEFIVHKRFDNVNFPFTQNDWFQFVRPYSILYFIIRNCLACMFISSWMVIW